MSLFACEKCGRTKSIGSFVLSAAIVLFFVVIYFICLHFGISKENPSLMSTETLEGHVFADSKEQERNLLLKKIECLRQNNTYELDGEEYVSPLPLNTSQGWYCPPVWDGIMCWNATPTNVTATQTCPDYIAGFDKKDYLATRRCIDEGHWYVNETLNRTWTNYTECYSTDRATVIMEFGLNNINYKMHKYFPIIKTMSSIGYTVSLVTLIIAFIIMFSIKKLHCARNKLHMHLFASFILRAFVTLLKDYIFVDGVGLRSDVLTKNGRSYFVDENETNNWGCKVVISFWQYFITANYSWILMEGLYLHNLIFLALFSDSNSSILWYILLGWGLPLFVICPWIVLRVIFENTFCWTTHTTKIFLMIRIPTMVSILVNLVLFVNIARVLLSKLQSPVTEETRRFQRWARSTLVLVPLFGVHYAVFLGMSYSINVNQTVEVVWLFCDQLFASFQGSFVAILYCFLNGEVRTELKPHFQQCFSFLLNKSCFNCDVEFIRTNRTSVCTTMSCSSLYNNGVNNRYRNGRSELEKRTKSILRQEKSKDTNHVCRSGGRSWQDVTASRWSSRSHSRCSPGACSNCTQQYSFCSNSNGSMQLPETTSCLDNRKERCRSEPQLDMELISMVPR